MTQASWGGEGLFSLRFHNTVHHQKKSEEEIKQGKDLEAGADAKARRGAAYWLVPHGLLTLPSYRNPGMAPPTVVWALPYQSIN